MSVAPGTSRHPYFPERGNEGYWAEHYELTLDYRVGANRLRASAVVSAFATARLEAFTLDLADALRVTAVTVDGVPARFTHGRDKLRVVPARGLHEGTLFVVEVRYGGNPSPVPSRWGGLGWEQLTDGVIVASQPTGAPSWFPCNDHPGDKSTYRVTVTTGSAYAVAANGRLAARRRGASTTTWVYEQAEPMATYLASVQIGRYQVTEVAGPVPQRLLHPARLASRVRADFARQGQMIALFTELFGPYPFASYTAVVADDDLEIPVEAQGMSIFGRNHVDGRRGEERLVAHELAHQWFGNSLTLGSWSEIWLHEGFAAYAEWLWSEASGGETADTLAGRWHRRLAELPQDFPLADPGPRRLFDDRVYKRGALTLHALRRTLGDDAFFALLREWTTTYQHGTVSTAQFTRLAARHAATPLTPLFTAWLHADRLPPLPARRAGGGARRTRP
ncbi:M1 family metallopeptidase [Sphaerisporangium sp. TRM90804]|uniref:M1 family metallopeptidase n=1 Tax=Sphaerisporangium sp. TRM90804 TaxID=3031113 RepID=UPI00244C9D5C|nr:M1 family metallopeptidase [Sphaerisporangium sp. TRM90804]MDH2426524.1 M1 family metallopeptidase [Sphaerisporangium sp. TRM90804]